MSTRRGRALPLDAHLHTSLSPDSNVPIDAYAALALERGIAEIAITDHVDFEPGAPAFGYTTFSERDTSWPSRWNATQAGLFSGSLIAMTAPSRAPKS